MKTQHHRHEPPRIVIPAAVIRVMAFIGYAIGGLLAVQLIAMLLFY